MFKKNIEKIIAPILVFSFIGLFFFTEAVLAQGKTSFSVLVPIAEMRTPLIEEKDLDSCFVNIMNGVGCSWDSIAWMAAKILMNVEFDGMIDMAQTGFFGDQSWIDNPDSYYSSMNTEVTDYFFQNDFNNADLLPSIKEDVRAAILKEETTPFEQRVAEGIDFPGGDAGYRAFLTDWNSCPTGDGWNCFDALMSRKNNKFLVTGITQEEVDKRQTEVLTNAKDEVLAGGGYRDDKEDCTYGHYIGCESITPGRTIGDQTNEALSASLEDQLGPADELDDVVTPAVVELYRTFVTWLNGGGLRGL